MAQGVPSAKVTKPKAEEARELGAFILRAWKEAGPRARGWVGANAETIKELASPSYLRRRLLRGRNGILVARKNGEIVGFIANRRLSETEVELTGVLVIQGKAGLGVGAELLQLAREAATKAKYRRMLVRTEADNSKAISFYKSNGFVELGEVNEVVDGERVAIAELAVDLG